MTQYQVATVELASSGAGARSSSSDAGPEPARNQVDLLLRVAAAGPSAVRLDGFEGEFAAVSDFGERFPLTHEGTTLAEDGATTFLGSASLPLHARSLKTLSGKIRAYPRGETVRLRLEPKDGAEARHASGLKVRLTRIVTGSRDMTLTLAAEWPETVSLRGESQEEALAVGTEVTGITPLLRPTSSESIRAVPDGKKLLKAEVRLPVSRTPPAAVLVEALVRTGPVIVRPFTLKDVRLPVAMEQVGDALPISGVVLGQKVLIGGNPAGPGTLEVGISTGGPRGWGAWRWTTVPTDKAGTALVPLPGTGRFRIRRRWSAVPESDGATPTRSAWNTVDVHLPAPRGRQAALPPLLLTGGAGAAEIPAPRHEVKISTDGIGMTIRARSIQCRAQGTLNYEFDPRQPYLSNSRLARLDLEVEAVDDASRLALASFTAGSVATPDSSSAERRPDEIIATTAENRLVMRITLALRNLSPTWESLREVTGDVYVYHQAQQPTLEIPLGTGQFTVFKDGDLRLRLDQSESPSGWTYRVLMEMPEEGVMGLPQTKDVELLDAARQPMAVKLIGTTAAEGNPRLFHLSFARPAAVPAFLRLPITVRSGNHKRIPFRLTGIPLPLSAPRR